MRTVRFLGEDCPVTFAQYSNGQTAITLSCEDGSPMATASVCLETHDGAPLRNDQTYIKEWGGNTGMVKALVDAGIVYDTGKLVKCGFCEASLVTILNVT